MFALAADLAAAVEDLVAVAAVDFVGAIDLVAVEGLATLALAAAVENLAMVAFDFAVATDVVIVVEGLLTV